MKKLPKFLIDLERLAEDITKTSLLMEKFGDDQQFSGLQIVGKSYALQARYLRSFPNDMTSLLKREALSRENSDIFGNEYLGINAYRYVELSFDPTYKTISSIRLLGATDKSTDKQNRFVMFKVDNTFDPTTVNIVSNIKEISDSVKELFGTSFLDPFKCSGEANVLSQLSPLPVSSITSQLTWTEFAKTYFYPAPQIISEQRSVSPDELEGISERFDLKLFKTADELASEDAELSSAVFKQGIANVRGKGFQVNNSGAEILQNSDSIKLEIQASLGDLGDPVAVLNRCYDEVFDKFSLGCLIKSAAECIIPPIDCKQMLRGLRVENLQERIELVFPNQPRIAELVNQEIQKLRDENPEQELQIERVLDAIENFIDLEAICDIKNFSVSVGSGVPTINLPDNLPIVDLYGQVSIEVENAILESLIESIKTMIIGILDDLASCDTLDAFVAGALEGRFGQDAGIAGELGNLFLNGEDFGGPDGAIAASLGQRWDQFAERTDQVLGQAVTVDASAAVDVFDGAISLSEQLRAVGGVTGLADGLSSGSINPVSGTVLIEQLFQADVDVTELLSFDGPGSESLNQVLKEIGRFELSDDGQSLTLQRISDDQVVTIARNASRRPAITGNIGLGDLSSAVGKVLDEVVSILSPGETLELLAGEPSDRVIQIVREIVRIKSPAISDAGDPVSLFVALGETTGLNQLRDQVILLAQNSNQKEVPRKYCVEDDDRISLREDLLSGAGLTDEEVSEEIDRIVDTRRIRYNDLADLLGNQGDFTSEEILENIRCGTGVQPNGKRPEIISDQLDATINIMFEPAKMAFDREVPKLVDAISTFKKTKKTISRTVDANDGVPVLNTENQGSLNLFQSAGDFLSGLGGLLGTEQKLNPEFRRLLNEGFVPLNPDGSEDGDSGNEIGPYANGDPIEVDDVVRETGGLFKEGIKVDQRNVKIKEDQNSIALEIAGSLKTTSPVNDYTPTVVSPPNWLLSYSEKGGEYDLRIKSRGEIPSKLYGRIPFFEDYFYSRVYEEDLPSGVRERLDSLSTTSEGEPSRKEAFSLLLFDKVKDALQVRNMEEPLREEFSEQYDDYLKDFLYDASRSFSRNRLLKKIPNKSLDNLGSATNVASQEDATQLIALNLINFSPAPSDEQIKCKAEPHLLDLESIKNLVKDQFDSECEDPNASTDGLEKQRKPINSAGFVGAILTMIRLYTVEYVFRSLFVFDEFGYSESFADDPLLIDYISSRVKEDIIRLGIWEKFEEELLIAYDKLVADGKLKVEKIPAEDDGSVGLADSQGTSKDSPYDKSTKSTQIKGVPEQLKAIVKTTLKSVLGKMATLVGIPENSDLDFNRSFVNSLDEIATYSNFEFEEVAFLSNFVSKNQRLPPSNGQRGRFILEKYVRVEQSRDSQLTRDIFRLQNTSPFLKDVVNFDNFEQMINELRDRGSGVVAAPVSDVFENPIRFGLRLVYVTPKIGEALPKEQVVGNPAFNKMNLGGFQPLNSDVIDREKSLYFTERLRNAEESDTYEQYNSIVIADSEIEIDEFNTLGNVNDIEGLYQDSYRERLLQEISQESDYQLMVGHSLLANRLVSLMVIYSTLAVNSEEMKFLFEGTKLELRNLFQTLDNLGDYTSRPDVGVAQNAIEYQAKFNNIGNPAGPSGADALYLAAITPILILRGLAELMDPNVFLTTKIQGAAAAGYFAPKLERVPGSVRIEGAPPSVPPIPFTPGSLATDNIFIRDETTDELIVKSEAVEEQVTDTGIVRTIREDLPPGAPIIAYTKVMEVELDEDDQPILDTNGQPILRTDASGNPIIKSGLGKKGVRIPGGEPSALDLAATAEGALSNLTFGTIGLTDIDPAFDIVESVPIYPGESLNLPFTLVSNALLPINVYGLHVPPGFCGPPINYSLGALQLYQYEPLLYQLPHFQNVFAESGVSEELKQQSGINLSGKEDFKCTDEEQ